MSRVIFTMLLCAIVSFAYSQALTVSATSTDATCPGNGTITATGSGGAGNYQYSLIEPSEQTRDPQSGQTFDGLPAGDYTVQVASGSETATTTVTVTDAYDEYTLDNVSFTAPTCPGGNDGTVTFNYTGGLATPATFEIFDSNGDLFATQDNGNFTDLELTNDDYTVKMTDGCSITQPNGFTVNAQYPNAEVKQTIPKQKGRDCTDAVYTQIVDGVKPINVVVTTSQGTTTYTTDGTTNSVDITVPHEAGIEIQATDACGNMSTVKTLDASDYTYFKVIEDVNCLYNVTLKDPALKSDATVPGEKEYCIKELNDTDWTCETGTESNEYTFEQLPAGTYETKIKDLRCDIEYTIPQFTIGTPKVVGPVTTETYTCLDGTATARIYLRYFDNTTEIEYVGPTLPDFTKSADNGGGTVAPNLVPGAKFYPDPDNLQRIQLKVRNLPVGTYNFTVKDDCDPTPTPITVEITADDIIDYTLFAEPILGCPGGNKIELGLDAAPKNYHSGSSALTIKDSNGVLIYSHPQPLRSIDDHVIIHNLDAGTYTATFRTTDVNYQSIDGYPDCPQTVTKEVVIPVYQAPSFINAEAYTCGSGQSITAQGEGLEPLTYEIAEIGTNNWINPNDNGIFVGYDASTQYKIRVSDTCTGSFVQEVGTPGTLDDPIVNIDYNCTGGSGNATEATFTATEVYNATYQWMKNGSFISNERVFTTNIAEGDQFTITVTIDDGSGNNCNVAQATKTITTTDCQQLLPIHLTQFWGKMNQRKAQLIWETAYEYNNDYFEIERTNNQYRWESIGKVSSKGDSQSFILYEFEDIQPKKGINYYRLKIVSNYQEVEYSQVIALTLDNLPTDIQVFPNPISNNSSAIVTVADKTDIDKIAIYNMLGSKLIDEIEINDKHTTISTAQYESGMYFIVAQSNGVVVNSVKLIVR